MAEQAVGLFSEEKFVEGYDLLKPCWPLPAAEVDNMANQTLQQWPVIKARFGASLGVRPLQTPEALDDQRRVLRRSAQGALPLKAQKFHR